MRRLNGAGARTAPQRALPTGTRGRARAGRAIGPKKHSGPFTQALCVSRGGARSSRDRHSTPAPGHRLRFVFLSLPLHASDVPCLVLSISQTLRPLLSRSCKGAFFTRLPVNASLSHCLLAQYEDLLHPNKSVEERKHKKKRLVQSPNSCFMDVKVSLSCFSLGCSSLDGLLAVPQLLRDYYGLLERPECCCLCWLQYDPVPANGRQVQVD